MSNQNSLKHEAKKVSGLVSEERQPFYKEDSGSHHYKFVRLPKVMPAKAKALGTKRELPAMRIMHIEEQEKKGKTEGWGLAALHAHQCCASQKHPAFVHLEQLLKRNNSLNSQRVTEWKFKEYLVVAKKLKSFIKDQLERPDTERKKRIIALIDDSLPAPGKDEQQEAWDEYFHTKSGAQLFEMPGTFK